MRKLKQKSRGTRFYFTRLQGVSCNFQKIMTLFVEAELRRLLVTKGLKDKIWLKHTDLSPIHTKEFLSNLEECKVQVLSYPRLKFDVGTLKTEEKPPTCFYLEIRSLSKAKVDKIAEFLGSEVFMHELGELDEREYVTCYGSREGKALDFLCHQTEVYWPLERWNRDKTLHSLRDAWFKLKDTSKRTVHWWTHAHADVRQMVQARLDMLVEFENELAIVLRQHPTDMPGTIPFLKLERFAQDLNLSPYLSLYTNLDKLRAQWEKKTSMAAIMQSLGSLRKDQRSWVAAKLEEKCLIVPYRKPSTMRRNIKFDKNYRLVYKRREFEAVCELSELLEVPLRFYPSLTLPTSKHGVMICDADGMVVDQLLTQIKPWFINTKRAEFFLEAQRSNAYFRTSKSCNVLKAYLRQQERTQTQS